ncbi:MAG: N-acetylmuramoyl-L-alanine amidase [Pseudomonadota bacterium]
MRVLLATVLMCVSAFSQADIKDVRIWQSPDNTRLVFDLTEPVEHKIFTLNNPHRVVIDLLDVKSQVDVTRVDVSDTAVKAIRSGVRNKTDLRIVLDISQQLTPKSFPLKPNKKYPYDRLVVDLEAKKAVTAIVAPVKQIRESGSSKRDIIIAIDAGHGGEDPGAIGPGRIYEKRIVLAIARELERLLKKEPGFQPFMVRTGDYYIGLRERTAKARKANADFFVSIHADAFKHPSAHGSSVFVLSERGATSEAARWLADKENESDLIGGVSLEDKEDHLAMTLLDLSMTAKRNSSMQIGSSILKQMGKVSRLHKKQVEEAAFVVLKAPDMPALLVETGFISNPGEAKKLSGRSYQKKMARAIFDGVNNYFQTHPPRGTWLAATINGETSTAGPRTYVVRRGDTLSAIAVRNRVALADIRRLNQLKSDTVRVGQTLKIPNS